MSDYSVDSFEWQVFDIRGLTAPATAATFEYTVRMYDDTGWIGSATVFIDGAELCGPPPPTATHTPGPTETATVVPSPTPSPMPTETFTPGPTATVGACEHDGDVNADGNVTPGDAQSAFNYYINCHAMNPTMQQYCSADFCGSGIISPCDGSVTPADAQGIMRTYLSYPDPCGKSAKAGVGQRVLRARHAPGATPATLTVEIELASDGQEIDAFGLEVQFDERVVEFQHCVVGKLNPGWLLFDGRRSSPGIVRVAGVAIDNQIGVTEHGQLAVLTFKRKPGQEGTAVPSFVLGEPQDDLHGAQIKN